MPPDFAGRVGFVAALEEHRDKKRELRYEPARFLVIILKTARVGSQRRWDVGAGANGGRDGTAPDSLSVRERRSWAGWLWSFGDGWQFVAATDAIVGADSDGRAARGDRDGWGWPRLRSENLKRYPVLTSTFAGRIPPAPVDSGLPANGRGQSWWG